MHPPPSRYSSAKYVLAHSQKPAKYLPGSVGRRSAQSTLESYTPPSPHRGPHALDCPSADRAELVLGLPVALECVWYSSGSRQMAWHFGIRWRSAVPDEVRRR